MMRSLFSGVSGLSNHQTRMDVIGNNVANVNTTGFKRSRVTFQDLLYQKVSSAAAPREEVGGINAKEVGLGMSIASIDTIHTQGNLQTTFKTTDMAIRGEGFFVLRQGGNDFFTRAGTFDFDREGNLVNPANGFRVQGWQADLQGNINATGDLEDLQIPLGSKEPALGTSNVFLSSNLDKRSAVGEAWVTTKEIYDSLGNTHELQISFTPDAATTNVWNAAVLINGEAPTTGATFSLQFDNLGALYNLVDDQGNSLVATNPDNTPVIGNNVALPITFNVPGSDAALIGAIQTVNINLGSIGDYKQSVTQFAQSSTTKIRSQDGYAMGYLETFRIDNAGSITGVFTNGVSRTLGQIALASFTNPGGLEQAGQNNFIQSNNSGFANIGLAMVEGRGSMEAGTLEMSNVDLADQFTDMIVTQRGFQANSRTIQTADQMLQELLTLKR